MNDPTPTSTGVWLPLSIAIPMMECYFGDGPRSRGRTDSSIPPPVPREAPEPVKPVPSSAPNSVVSPLAGFTPRGAAARAYTPATAPKNPADVTPAQPTTTS